MRGVQEGSVVEMQAWHVAGYPDKIPRIGIRSAVQRIVCMHLYLLSLVGHAAYFAS